MYPTSKIPTTKANNVIVTSVDKNNVVLAIDIVQAKYLVSILREATEEQLTLSSKEVFDSGFDDGSPANALAATRSFANVLGFYTDKVEAVGVPKTEKEAELNDACPPKGYRPN